MCANRQGSPPARVDQIDAGTHACCIGRGDSGGDVFRRMRTVERCKHMRYRGLHAEGNTIETAVCEFFHIVGIHRVGIRFGGDFRVIGDAPCGAYRIQHGDQIACLECGRVPPPKKTVATFGSLIPCVVCQSRTIAISRITMFA